MIDYHPTKESYIKSMEMDRYFPIPSLDISLSVPIKCADDIRQAFREIAEEVVRHAEEENAASMFLAKYRLERRS